MLEKPDLDEQALIDCLQDAYGLRTGQLAFLPLGADLNTAVYRAVNQDRTAYFVKLRRGAFNQASVTVPQTLAGQGMRQVIPALTTRSGQLWAELGVWRVILYPFVEGHNGYEKKLTPEQWVEFGQALRRLHEAHFPVRITAALPREDFSPGWCDALGGLLDHLAQQTFTDAVAAALAGFVRVKRAEIQALIAQTVDLARELKAQPLELVVCHADIHAWNLLTGADGALFLVDWDTLTLAPKERDLMFIGAGLGDSGFTPAEEEDLFYRGYGPTALNLAAIAYYRCVRIVEDLVVDCQHILSSQQESADRRQSLVYLQSNFAPGSTLERAVHALERCRRDPAAGS